MQTPALGYTSELLAHTVKEFLKRVLKVLHTKSNYFGRLGGGCAFLAGILCRPGEAIELGTGCQKEAITSVDIELLGNV